jgi:hypothetical protein
MQCKITSLKYFIPKVDLWLLLNQFCFTSPQPSVSSRSHCPTQLDEYVWVSVPPPPHPTPTKPTGNQFQSTTYTHTHAPISTDIETTINPPNPLRRFPASASLPDFSPPSLPRVCLAHFRSGPRGRGGGGGERTVNIRYE